MDKKIHSSQKFSIVLNIVIFIDNKELNIFDSSTEPFFKETRTKPSFGWNANFIGSDVSELTLKIFLTYRFQ